MRDSKMVLIKKSKGDVINTSAIVNAMVAAGLGYLILKAINECMLELEKKKNKRKRKK
jgi:hypothetical protein